MWFSQKKEREKSRKLWSIQHEINVIFRGMEKEVIDLIEAGSIYEDAEVLNVLDRAHVKVLQRLDDHQQ